MDAQHAYPKVPADVEFDDGFVRPVRREGEFGNLVVVGKRHQVEDIGGDERTGDALPHIALREDNAVSADLIEDAGMEVIDGLREDFGDASFLEQNRCEDAGADIRANGNDGGIEVLHAEFRKRILIHGIRLNRLRHVGRDGLYQLLVSINREHLMS